MLTHKTRDPPTIYSGATLVIAGVNGVSQGSLGVRDFRSKALNYFSITVEAVVSSVPCVALGQS